jgi:hypothetical protein
MLARKLPAASTNLVGFSALRGRSSVDDNDLRLNLDAVTFNKKWFVFLLPDTVQRRSVKHDVPFYYLGAQETAVFLDDRFQLHLCGTIQHQIAGNLWSDILY